MVCTNNHFLFLKKAFMEHYGLICIFMDTRGQHTTVRSQYFSLCTDYLKIYLVYHWGDHWSLPHSHFTQRCHTVTHLKVKSTTDAFHATLSATWDLLFMAVIPRLIFVWITCLTFKFSTHRLSDRRGTVDLCVTMSGANNACWMVMMLIIKMHWLCTQLYMWNIASPCFIYYPSYSCKVAVPPVVTSKFVM